MKGKISSLRTLRAKFKGDHLIEVVVMDSRCNDILIFNLDYELGTATLVGDVDDPVLTPVVGGDSDESDGNEE